jgi:hypothetical protein
MIFYLTVHACKRGRSFARKSGRYLWLCFEEVQLADLIFIEHPEWVATLRGADYLPVGMTENLYIRLSGWCPEYLLDRGLEPDPEAHILWCKHKLDDIVRAESEPIATGVELAGSQVRKQNGVGNLAGGASAVR